MGRLKALPPRIGTLPPRVAAMPKVADPFYQSREWSEARRRQPDKWCVVCGSRSRLVLDHKVERKDGGADLDPANLQWLCHAHHQAKTSAERAKRARGDGGVVKSLGGRAP